jgi:hypothetical protein
MFSASLRTGITTESSTEARGENGDYPIASEHCL